MFHAGFTDWRSRTRKPPGPRHRGAGFWLLYKLLTRRLDGGSCRVIFARHSQRPNPDPPGSLPAALSPPGACVLGLWVSGSSLPAGATMQAWRRLDVAVRYTLADAVFSGLLVTPLAVLFTVGTEAIIRRVSIDHAPVTTSVLLLLAAIAVQFAAGYHQRDIAAWISRQPEVCAEAAARVYTYVYAIANVCHYAALEELFDVYAEDEDDGGLRTAAKLLVSSIVVLAGLRCCRNVIGPPLYVATDTEGAESVVETSTLFGVEVRLKHELGRFRELGQHVFYL